ncbi:MAG: hypothetical protein RLZZ161_924 [Bacteroidota bacterium]
MYMTTRNIRFFLYLSTGIISFYVLLCMQRTRLKEILAHMKAKEWTILTGARQVGKTTLLKDVMMHLEEKQESVFYLTLEDAGILKSISEDPENLFRYTLAPQKDQKRVYVLIDEIQYLPDPTHFLKLLFDKYAPVLKIVATGSSAFYIDQKFKDSLAGRKRLFHIYPLCFEEFLLFKGENKLRKELQHVRTQTHYISAEQKRLNILLEEYITYGGYPAVVLQNDPEEKKAMLQELLFSFVRKDMLESGVEEEDKFYQLMRLLAAQCGNLINRSEISNTLRINERTLERYLNILRKCFHIQLVRPWHENLRKEITKMPKVYFNDTGLCNALLRNFLPPEQRQDKGMLLEHFVFHALREKYDPDFDIHFWRTTAQHEVDFLIETGQNQGFALEVKWQEKEFKRSKYRQYEEKYGAKFPLKPACLEFIDAAHWVLKI